MAAREPRRVVKGLPRRLRLPFAVAAVVGGPLVAVALGPWPPDTAVERRLSIARWLAEVFLPMAAILAPPAFATALVAPGPRATWAALSEAAGLRVLDRSAASRELLALARGRAHGGLVAGVGLVAWTFGHLTSSPGSMPALNPVPLLLLLPVHALLVGRTILGALAARDLDRGEGRFAAGESLLPAGAAIVPFAVLVPSARRT